MKKIEILIDSYHYSLIYEDSENPSRNLKSDVLLPFKGKKTIKNKLNIFTKKRRK